MTHLRTTRPPAWASLPHAGDCPIPVTRATCRCFQHMFGDDLLPAVEQATTYGAQGYRFVYHVDGDQDVVTLVFSLRRLTDQQAQFVWDELSRE